MKIMTLATSIILLISCTSPRTIKNENKTIEQVTASLISGAITEE